MNKKYQWGLKKGFISISGGSKSIDLANNHSAIQNQTVLINQRKMNPKNRIYLKILIGICLIALAFHFLILLKIIPYEITWGGKLKNDSEMYVFEFFSISINSFLLYVLLQKGSFVKPIFRPKTITVILWVFFGIFALNTLGNLFAETNFEKSFSILTLINAVFIWIINRANSSLQKLQA